MQPIIDTGKHRLGFGFSLQVERAESFPANADAMAYCTPKNKR
jgi:hypothetical protein